MVEPESPRIDFLLAELRMAMSRTREGLRADGLHVGEMYCRLSYEVAGIEIVPVPIGAHKPLISLLKYSLEDLGFTVSDLECHGLIVHDCKRRNPNIH